MRKHPKSVDMGKAPFYLALVLFAAIGYGVWSTATLIENNRYVSIGKSVDCLNRPNWETLQRCDSRVEGIACAEESQTNLMHFVGSIDYACAQYEPAQRFRFPVYSRPEGQEMAEAG